MTEREAIVEWLRREADYYREAYHEPGEDCQGDWCAHAVVERMARLISSGTHNKNDTTPRNIPDHT